MTRTEDQNRNVSEMENERGKQKMQLKIDQNTFKYMIKTDQITVIFIKNNKY